MAAYFMLARTPNLRFPLHLLIVRYRQILDRTLLHRERQPSFSFDPLESLFRRHGLDCFVRILRRRSILRAAGKRQGEPDYDDKPKQKSIH